MVGRTEKDLFITTGTFTAEAKKEAMRDGAPAIDLIDGDSLCDLLKNLKLGATTKMVEVVSVDPSWFGKILGRTLCVQRRALLRRAATNKSRPRHLGSTSSSGGLVGNSDTSLG